MTSLEWLATMPEFKAVSEATKTAYIGLAGRIDTSLFCQDSAYVVALYAGHLMSLTATKTSAAGGGAISSISEGGLSIAYAASNLSSSYFDQTPSGRALKSLMRGSFVSMGIV